MVAAAGISLTAGAAWGPGSLDGVGRSAYFNRPAGIATDASGTLYVSDGSPNCTIRKVGRDGAVATLAGRSRVCAMQDGNGTDGLFLSPGDIAAGPDGTVYVMDWGKLRRVTQQGEVTTIDLPVAGLDTVAAGPDGALYLAKGFDGAAVYRLAPGASLALLAGQPGTPGTADGVGSQAQFSNILDLAVDSSNNVYVTQNRQHTIRKIAPDGTVTTFAGVAGQMGLQDGIGAAALLSMPGSLAVDPQGFVWFVDLGSSMFRRISPAGEVTSPFRNSAPLLANFNQVGALAFGASGYLHFTLPLGVARITSAGVISSLAGQDFAEGTPIGNVTQLVADAAGNPVVTTRELAGDFSITTLVRKFGPNGELLPVGPGEQYLADAAGNHYFATLIQGGGINLVTNLGGYLNKVSPNGEVSRLDDPLFVVANGSVAPAALTVGADGSLYFTDLIKGNLLRWKAGEGMAVLANVGAAEPSYIVPTNPRALAVDSAGRVYILSRTVLERYQNGVVATVAGVKGQPGTSDGTGSQARFTAANAIVADAAGNVYVADGSVIRKVTPAGVVTTVVGQVGHVGLRTGPLPGSLGIVTQLAIGPDGVLHLTADNALVKVRLQ